MSAYVDCLDPEIHRINDGDRVYVRRKKHERLQFGPIVEGTGTVRIHWHYERCMFNIDMDTGGEGTICPDLGDEIRLLDNQSPPTVLEQSATLYRAVSP